MNLLEARLYVRGIVSGDVRPFSLAENRKVFDLIHIDDEMKTRALIHGIHVDELMQSLTE